MPGPDPTAVGFELSPQQKRLWRLAGGSSGPYRTLCEVRVDGGLEPRRLRAALDRLVERHEILRTVLRRREGLSVPLQVVLVPGQAEAAELAWCDVSALPDAMRERPLAAARRELEDRLLPLEEPSLVVRCLRLGVDRHHLLLALSGTRADRFGVARLVRELAEAVEALERSVAEEIQYADLAQWLNGFLRDEDAAEGRAWWRRRVGGLAPARLHPRSSGDPWQPCVVAQVLAGDPVDRLRSVASDAGVSPEALLLALWSILLGRSGAGSEVAVAVAFEGREYAELESTPGPLERYLPMLARWERTTTLAELATGLASDLDQARSFQECFSWELALGEPLPESAPSYGFAWRRGPESFTTGGRRWHLRSPQGYREPFTAELVVEERSAELELSLVHDGRLLSSAEAADWLARFRRAAEECRGGSPIHRLPLLPEAEIQRLRADAGVSRLAAEGEEGAAEPLPRRILARARREPERPAVTDRGGTLTYGDLAERSAALARRLVAAGVGPETAVPILAPPGRAFFVALLAAWRAGGAYAALDPAQPAPRLGSMLEDLAAPALVVSGPGAAVLEETGWSGPVLHLGDDGEPLGEAVAGPPDGLDRVVPAASLAYVLFTSGSTGRPKPVSVEHRNLAHYVDAVVERLGLGRGTTAALVSSPAADLGHTAIFTVLATGGELRVLVQEAAADPAALARELEAHPVDLLKVVPGHLEALLAVEGPHRVLPREVLVTGGEALPPTLVERVRELAPGLRLVNHYGPTETTVGAVTHELAADGGVETVPLGRPLDGTAVHVLEDGGALVPYGVPGELWIAGAGVARGYLGRPGETARRFVPDPFTGVPGGRAYRTGDRVRRRRDGLLEFLGRVDRQFKLRGFRIEPGEVEAVLAALPQVRQAVVRPWQEPSGAQRLVAYCVPAPDAAADSPALRAALASRLPEVMVPTDLVFLDDLPRTPNGKVDVGALPAPDVAADAGRPPYSEPRGPVEAELAAVWKEVLGVERVGRDDNFFHLGGDSILSIQVVARANARQLRITPHQMFLHQTVAELATVALRSTAVAVDEDDGPVEGPVPLTPIQHRFFATVQEQVQHYNQSLLLAVRVPLEPALLAAAVDALVEHHDALRLRFRQRDGRWQARLAPPGERCWSVVDLSALPEERHTAGVETLAAMVQGGLRLDGPLFRVVAMRGRGAGGGDRLLLVAHHLVVDGVSWRILLDDLAALHRELSAGRSVRGALPPRSTSYRRWSESLARMAAEEPPVEQLDHWLHPVRRDVGRLPTEGEGPDRRRDTSSFALRFDQEATEGLLARAARDGGRGGPEPLLLAALARALVGFQGSGPVLLDLEGHGRENLFPGSDLSRTVGWFTAVHPLVVELPDAAATAQKDLAAVRRALDRIPDRGLGYGLLRWLDAAGASPSLAELPPAQVVFNYLGRLDRVLDIRGPFAPAPESAGPQQAPEQHRPYLLEVTAEVVEGRLRVIFGYGVHRFSRPSVEDLAGRFRAALDALLAVHAGAGPSGDAAAEGPDLSQVDLDEDQLSAILSRLGGGETPS